MAAITNVEILKALDKELNECKEQQSFERIHLALFTCLNTADLYKIQTIFKETYAYWRYLIEEQGFYNAEKRRERADMSGIAIFFNLSQFLLSMILVSFKRKNK